MTWLGASTRKRGNERATGPRGKRAAVSSCVRSLSKNNFINAPLSESECKGTNYMIHHQRKRELFSEKYKKGRKTDRKEEETGENGAKWRGKRGKENGLREGGGRRDIYHNNMEKLKNMISNHVNAQGVEARGEEPPLKGGKDGAAATPLPPDE